MSDSPSLTIRQGVAMVKRFYQANPHPTSVQVALNSVTSEVGELVKEYDKSTGYGTKEFEPTESFVEELGDVLFNIFHVAVESGVDINSAFVRVIEKYEYRVKENGSMGSGK